VFAAVFHQAGFGGLDRRSDVPCVCAAVAMPKHQQQQLQPMMYWQPPQMPMQHHPSTGAANASSSDAEQQDIENNDAY
jgi:hypothetical protein